MKSAVKTYTDAMRVSAVTTGHGVALAGEGVRSAPCPIAKAIGTGMIKAGDAIATRAVDQCSRDTPRLLQCVE